MIIMKITHTPGEGFITFHRTKWENLAGTENSIPRIAGVLKKFIINVTKVIAINMNPVVTKVALNS